MGTDSYSFTPVRRRECGIKQQLCATDSQIWTASRCQRLLRTLQSKVEILKKSQRFTSASKNSEQLASKTSTPKDPKRTERYDLEWGHASKRARRTYAGQGKSKGEIVGANYSGSQCQTRNSTAEKAFIPGEISVPTPLLNRANLKDRSCQGPNFCPADKDTRKSIRRPERRFATKDGEAHFELKENMRRLRRLMSPEIHALHVGIFNALEALLRATSPAAAVETQNPKRSLLSMCLRSVPLHIAQQEYLETLYAETEGFKSSLEVRDVTVRVYGELESLGSSERGWKHLRTVVRAHGVRIVSRAITDGLVDAKFVGVLVMLCVHTGSVDEAEIILESSVMASQYPDPKSPEDLFGGDPEFLSLVAMDRFVRYTGRRNYHYRQLSRVFASKKLPVSWLVTKEFVSVWTNVFRSLLLDQYNNEATSFMATALPLMFEVGVQSGGLWFQFPENTMTGLMDSAFASLLAMFSSLCLLDQKLIGSTVQLPASRGNAVNLLTSIVLDCGRLSFSRSLYSALLFMTSVLLYPTTSRPPSLKSLSYDFGSEDGPAKEKIAMFLSSVVRNCGRGASNNGFEYLKFILCRLESTADEAKEQMAKTLQEVIVDTAYAFAKDNPDRAHLQYAETLGMKFHEPHFQPKPSTSETQTDKAVSFRWEDGIAEWVTATPALALKKHHRSSQPIWDEESDCDTPLRLVLKSRRTCASGRLRSPLFGDAMNTNLRVSDLVPSSPPPTLYHDNRLSGNEALLSLNHRSSFESDDLLLASQDDRRPCGAKRTINKTPRLGREVLRSDHCWNLFDDNKDSNNESSSSTKSLNKIPGVLKQPLNNDNEMNRPMPQKTSNWNASIFSRSRFTQNELDSEDELAI